MIIAGPCSAESREQVLKTASELAARGVKIFRAGIWKPRTKPGGFEGIGVEGLPWMKQVKQETGMLVATEVATPRPCFRSPESRHRHPLGRCPHRHQPLRHAGAGRRIERRRYPHSGKKPRQSRPGTVGRRDRTALQRRTPTAGRHPPGIQLLREKKSTATLRSGIFRSNFAAGTPTSPSSATRATSAVNANW